MKLITHSHLVLILMSGVLSLFSLFGFKAWTGISLQCTSHNGWKFALLTISLASLERNKYFPLQVAFGYNTIQQFLHAFYFNRQYTIGKHFSSTFNPYPTAFPYGNGMVLHFYQQQESSTTKTVHKVINKGLKTYV